MDIRKCYENTRAITQRFQTLSFSEHKAITEHTSTYIYIDRILTFFICLQIERRQQINRHRRKRVIRSRVQELTPKRAHFHRYVNSSITSMTSSHHYRYV